MTLEPISTLPKPDEVLADWTIYSQGDDESSLNLLVYASHRDFLSAPLTYTVVSLKSNNRNGISQVEVDCLDILSHAENMPENGIYHQLDKGSVIATLIVCDDSIAQISGKIDKQITQIYYAPNAKAALAEYLGQ